MDENKLRNTKGKEKRQAYSQNDLHSKRTTKFPVKSDLTSLAPPQPLGSSSPVKKYLSEANKIIKIGIEKEFALQEKDEALQKLSETIDNLRKNIIHLQMEYEKLDQNYQREISCRTEIVKRMDTTRGIVESAVHYSNTLSASVKQLEDDKLKIAEFYEMIYAGQKEVEDKHSKLEKMIEEKEVFIQSRISEIKKVQDETTTQTTETISRLNRELIQKAEKLESATIDNEKLEEKLQDLRKSLSELETALAEQQRLNLLQKESSEKLEPLLKSCKFQKFRYQKLFRNEKKKSEGLQNGYRILKKKMRRNEELTATDRSAVEALKNENEELKMEISKYQEILEGDRTNWECTRRELIQQMKTKEDETESLKTSNKVLGIQILDLKKLEEEKEAKLQQVRDDLYKMAEDRRKLEEDLKMLREEKEKAKTLVIELEQKLKRHGDDFHSEVALYKNEAQKYEKMMKDAERRLEEAEKAAAIERTQKDILMSDLNQKLEENMKETTQKTSDMQKEAHEKAERIQKLLDELKEKESLMQDLKSQMSNSTTENIKALEKLKDESKNLTTKNESLSSSLDSLREKNQTLTVELDESRNQITTLEKKLQEEKSTNKALKSAKIELEKKSAELKKEMDAEKKSSESLRQKQKKADSELQKLQKVAEENSNLKATIADLKKQLEGAEAKVEAYKIVVKKLETEKAEAKDQEEICKLRLEINHLKDLLKKNGGKKDVDEDKLDIPGSCSKIKPAETPKQSKENLEPVMPEIIAIGPNPATPLQPKKFLSTPRKILSSTPQPSFRAFTPCRKKRDPYEFDSDSSVERFDPDQVLKIFNNRPKRESAKKTKTNK